MGKFDLLVFYCPDYIYKPCRHCDGRLTYSTHGSDEGNKYTILVRKHEGRMMDLRFHCGLVGTRRVSPEDRHLYS